MKGLRPKEIKAELDNVHLHQRLWLVDYNWVNEFKHDHISIYDAPRSERPIEAAMSEIIGKILDIVLTDRFDESNCASLLRPQAYHSDFNFARIIEYEKTIGKMSAAFAHCGS